MDEALRAKINDLVRSRKVLLFMKGNRQFPQCGFSNTVVQTLNAVGAEYDTVNILADPQLREGMKAYSNWPTFPQLYVNGELVGGCDIVKDLHARGELAALIQKAGAVRA
ncbi:MAG: Grx4 family monothiol glutaredoxin [Deltaproteobacteria bacterium]|nr:Grx4 family monothiol glutaredoxin [Deltaproteobacteria bacterium]